VKKNISCKYN